MPSLARGQAGLALAWVDQRTDAPGVYVSIVDEELRTSGPQRVTAGQGARMPPSMVWTGLEYLLAWLDEASPGQVHLARVSSQGRVLEVASPKLSADQGRLGVLALAASTSEALLVVGVHRGENGWLERAILRPGMLAASFAPVVGPGSLAREPAALADDRGWMLAWIDGRDQQAQLRIGRLDPTGKMATDLPVDHGPVRRPSLARGSGGGMVAWEREWHAGPRVRVAPIVSEAGLRGPFQELPRPGQGLRATWSGARFVLTWVSSEYGLTTVAELTPELKLLGEPRLVTFDQGLRAEHLVLSVDSKGDYLAAWEESGWGTHQIALRRLSPLSDSLGTGFVASDERLGQLFVSAADFTPYSGQPQLEGLRCGELSLPSAWKLRDESEDAVGGYVVLPYEPLRRLVAVHLLLTRSSEAEGNVFVRFGAGTLSETERALSSRYEWPHPSYLFGEACRWRGHTVPVTNFPLRAGEELLWLTVKREGAHRLDNLHAPAFFLGAVIEYAADGS